MFNKLVIERSQAAIEIYLNDRIEFLKTGLLTLDRELSSRGLYKSGTRIARANSLHVDELNLVSEELINSLMKFNRIFGSCYSAEAEEEINNFYLSRITAVHDILKASLHKAISQTSGPIKFEDITHSFPSITKRAQHCLTTYFDELRHAVEPVSKSMSFTFNAPVGGVQTGDRAVGTFNIDQRSSINSSLDEVAAFLIKAKEAGHNVDDVIDINEDIRQEADKPAPNKTKLQALFSVLTQTVQTLGASDGARAAITASAAAFGISI